MSDHATHSGDGRSEPQNRSDHIQVLYVEDDADFAELAVMCLETETDRVSIEHVSSAETGLDRLTDTIDCIVSDHDMPGKDGIEFLTAVREDYPDLPFILFTGKGSEEVASEAISAGVTDYLQKEGGTDQFAILANRITNAVEKYRAQRNLKQQNTRLNTVLWNAPVVLFALDPNGVFTLSRGRGLAELGLDPGEVVGESIFEVYAGYDSIISAAERALDGDQVTKTQTVAGLVFKTVYQPVRDPDGDVTSVIGVAYITERLPQKY